MLSQQIPPKLKNTKLLNFTPLEYWHGDIELTRDEDICGIRNSLNVETIYSERGSVQLVLKGFLYNWLCCDFMQALTNILQSDEHRIPSDIIYTLLDFCPSNIFLECEILTKSWFAEEATITLKQIACDIIENSNVTTPLDTNKQEKFVWMKGIPCVDWTDILARKQCQLFSKFLNSLFVKSISLQKYNPTPNVDVQFQLKPKITLHFNDNKWI
ncbi:hypothetical protein RFI_26791 [Reticulomyxa filosa]|uniref:Uncharacterized protein n=1 Tax=Reticulomyxa filosa TaxID=46433 RepID=X6M9A8_RETFI|nr:hypothetical protein RFI_26791 [Reticulomyxa filosa]|eukprot:ETO10588.1 hypothetical protein RFI_26791 [Reticulomyxa filosa]